MLEMQLAGKSFTMLVSVRWFSCCDAASEHPCPMLLNAFPVKIGCAHSGTITSAYPV